ncbi:general substrate transporter [Choanephora cucurbitarum]|nr:general substrate transporter [Choanephora cucurbitarum]
MSYQHPVRESNHHTQDPPYIDSTQFDDNVNNQEKQVKTYPSTSSGSDVYTTKRKTSNGFTGFVKNPYVCFTAVFASIGGVLFGYDQGVISGVQEMDDFVNRFPLNSTQTGFMVSILELGAWVGAWIIGYFADRISRKYSIILATVIFLLGSSIQGGAQNIGYLLGGRFVTGMGVGSLSLLVPLYQSEISPPEIRGSLVSLQQLAVTFGILISFWIDYGLTRVQGEASWRVPLCIQIAFALVLGVGILFFPFSPRWLMSKGREEEALQVISKLRRLPQDHPDVVEEWKEIKATVEFDRIVERQQYPQYIDQGSKGRLMIELAGYRELFRKGIFNRVVIGSMIMFFQQFTGMNALIYYAPKIFQSVGLTGNSVSLLATGVVGIINFVMTFPTVFFLDVVGRKIALMVASVLMAICMIIVAIITALFQHDWPNHTAEGWVSVAFIYVFIACFACTWGPIGWVIPAEIFPLRARAKAMSVTTSSNWMNNFIIGLIVPVMLENITYGTYIFFACFLILSFFFVWFFVPETKGRTLEEMDEIFGGQSAVHDADIMNQVQNNINQQPINKQTPA